VGDIQTLYFYVVRLSNRLRQHSTCDVLGSNRVHSVRRRGNSADAAVPRQHRRRFRQVFSILLHAGACDRFIVRQYSIQYNIQLNVLVPSLQKHGRLCITMSVNMCDNSYEKKAQLNKASTEVSQKSSK